LIECQLNTAERLNEQFGRSCPLLCLPDRLQAPELPIQVKLKKQIRPDPHSVRCVDSARGRIFVPTARQLPPSPY
jgi:hypothetical protein